MNKNELKSKIYDKVKNEKLYHEKYRILKSLISVLYDELEEQTGGQIHVVVDDGNVSTRYLRLNELDTSKVDYELCYAIISIMLTMTYWQRVILFLSLEDAYLDIAIMDSYSESDFENWCKSFHVDLMYIIDALDWRHEDRLELVYNELIKEGY